MTAYSTLLKDPRWQKKRLKILERDYFACLACGDGESTLHVHHCYYEKGKKPWEYEDSSLLTLCEECHETESELFYEGKNLLSNSVAAKGLLFPQMQDLGEMFYLMKFKTHDEYAVSALKWFLTKEGALDTISELYREHISSTRKNGGGDA